MIARVLPAVRVVLVLPMSSSIRATPCLIRCVVDMAWVVHILTVTQQDGLAGIVFKISDLELKLTVAPAGPSDRCDVNKTRQENHGKHPYKIGQRHGEWTQHGS